MLLRDTMKCKNPGLFNRRLRGLALRSQDEVYHAILFSFNIQPQEDQSGRFSDDAQFGGEVKTRTKRGSLTVRIEPNTQPQLRFSGGGGIVLPNTPKVRDFLIRLYILAQSLGYAA
jgi:hypothetical protein